MELKMNIQKGQGQDTVYFGGSLTEMASDEIQKLKQADLANTVVFNFRHVERVNSSGMHLWIRFLRDFQNGRDITYTECSNEIVHQMNMIPSFCGNAKVESFYVSVRCGHCDRYESVLFQNDRPMDDIIDAVEEYKCRTCNGEMEIEEDPTTYFEFLEKVA